MRVRGLRKAYRDVTAVDGVDLDISHGEVFALLGPNGAGKTTTVEILEGYRQRDGGEVTVLGTDPGRGGREWRSRIGIVLQSNTDADELTVREMIRYFAAYYPSHADPDEVIEIVGLTEKAGSRLRQLSGGQRRRVDVALGIVGRPELLFLDEPTTGFDPEARRQFWHLIKSLADGGTTILLTTHYLDEAEALADRVAVIAAGRIRAVGPPVRARRPGQRPGHGQLAVRRRPPQHRDATRRRPWSPSCRAVRRRGPGADGHPALAGRHLPRDDRSCRRRRPGEPASAIPRDHRSNSMRQQAHAAGAGPNAARTRSAAAVSRCRGPASRSQRSAREGGREMSATQ